VYQSSFQHDKCQVGDMHTYCRDLVPLGGSTIVEEGEPYHFSCNQRTSIHNTFHQSLSYLVSSYHCTQTRLITIPVGVPVSLGAGLKRWVVRPVRNSLSERIVEDRFPEGAKLWLQRSETSGLACC
jgi:hypothetical protein